MQTKFYVISKEDKRVIGFRSMKDSEDRSALFRMTFAEKIQEAMCDAWGIAEQDTYVVEYYEDGAVREIFCQGIIN